MSCESNFTQQLRSRGFRMTPQRELILAVLHEMEGFSTAEEIYQRVTLRSTAVDISTVYRTLELLRGFDMLHFVKAPDGQRRYRLEGAHGAHLHLICRCCGHVIGVRQGDLDAISAVLQEHYAFQTDLGNATLSGLCASCQAAAPDSDPTD